MIIHRLIISICEHNRLPHNHVVREQKACVRKQLERDSGAVISDRGRQSHSFTTDSSLLLAEGCLSYLKLTHHDPVTRIEQLVTGIVSEPDLDDHWIQLGFGLRHRDVLGFQIIIEGLARRFRGSRYVYGCPFTIGLNLLCSGVLGFKRSTLAKLQSNVYHTPTFWLHSMLSGF